LRPILGHAMDLLTHIYKTFIREIVTTKGVIKYSLLFFTLTPNFKGVQLSCEIYVMTSHEVDSCFFFLWPKEKEPFKNGKSKSCTRWRLLAVSRWPGLTTNQCLYYIWESSSSTETNEENKANRE
jgi:hypothetical protein